ncbi:FKBP12-associated protein [Pestalotiopsis sp. IQ-011]
MDGGERGGRNPRGRAGRHRGGRGGRGGRGRGGGAAAAAAATGQQSQSSEAAPAAAGTASSTHTQPHSGRGSRRRGNANSRRGGTNAGQRPTFGSQRTFGGQLTSGPQREAEEQNPSGSLSVDAHDFVPGQSSHEARITADDSSPKGMAKHVRRGSRSNAADLATRIHEDITNGQYDPVPRRQVAGDALAAIQPWPTSPQHTTVGVTRR